MTGNGKWNVRGEDGDFTKCNLFPGEPPCQSGQVEGRRKKQISFTAESPHAPCLSMRFLTKRQIIIATVLSFSNFGFAQSQEQETLPDPTMTFRPYRGFPEYKFVPTGVDAYGAERISVFRIAKGGKKRIQTLVDPETDSGFLPIEGGRVAWQVQDLNFDGFLDVGFRSSKSTFYYWLFEPKTGRFKLNETLSALPNAEVDKKRHVLVSHELHKFGYEEFKWKHGKLVMSKTVSEEDALKQNRQLETR